MRRADEWRVHLAAVLDALAFFGEAAAGALWLAALLPLYALALLGAIGRAARP